jgi:hypothetical protein
MVPTVTGEKTQESHSAQGFQGHRFSSPEGAGVKQ